MPMTDVENFKTGKVTDFKEMFADAWEMAPNVTFWNMESAQNVDYMFKTSKANVNTSLWVTSKVTRMAYMFRECTSQSDPIDTRSWDMSKVETLENFMWGV